MMIESDGTRWLSPEETAEIGNIVRIRGGLRVEVRVRDGDFRSVFLCDNAVDAERAVSLRVKEPGTMAWLDAGLAPGDRFLDIGANNGIYTIAAAHRVGPGGHVWAVEPHKASALALFGNVAANGFGERISVLSFPLSDGPAVDAFHYDDMSAASSGSQFGAPVRANRGRFDPVTSELALATSLDDLIARGAVAPPDLVKIDVDGLEPRILAGMMGLLTSEARPRSLQVELNAGDTESAALLAQAGYALARTHLSPEWQRRIDEGHPPEKVPRNAIFEPA